MHIGAYLEYFKAAGHDVRFVSLSPSPERGVLTYNVGLGKKYSASEGKWKYPLSMLRARRLVKKLRPEVVHAHYATSGGLAGLVCGFHPTVVTVHGTDLTTGMKSGLWRRLLRAVFRHADCVNTVSEDLKNMVLELGISPDKVQVLSLGIDTRKFSFAKRRDLIGGRTLRLVCTRHMDRHYGQQTIIKALDILARAGVDFQMTLVGDGPSKQQLVQQVADANLKERVVFRGVVDNELLPEILHEHDVYLSASWWDGTSLSLLEAMATGVFPIVSDIKANSSWLRHGIDGFLHKVDDEEDLAKCIMQLLDKSEIAAQAAQRNREMVVEKADRDTCMKRLACIYEELILQAGQKAR